MIYNIFLSLHYYLIHYTTCGTRIYSLSFCECIQRPEELSIDAPFIIPIGSEELSESI